MTNPDDLAFPRENTPGHGTLGLTKREKLAAMAHAALLSNPQVLMAFNDIDPKMTHDHIATVACQHADALIRALNQTSP